jgi:hypothetical protein
VKRPSMFLWALALAGTLLSGASILEVQQVTVPEGTVIELRMQTGLSSRDSRTRDTFKASVSRPVWVDGKVAIPENSSIDGRVTTVQPAERSSHSGVIGVEFYQISVNGRPYSIEGALTSLKADERKQIIDEESRITGRSSQRRTILFIGGGAGVGAAIGALLSRGAEAEVPAGSEVAMQLVRPLTVNSDNRVLQTGSK